MIKKNQRPSNPRPLLDTNPSPFELQLSKMPKVPTAGESFKQFERFINPLSSNIHLSLGTVTVAPLFKRAGRSEPPLQYYSPLV